ncbi:ABC transporter ATP-binding protein [Variovorax sp. E3]|uniref:ABC transporter ATP-binding protein n=1 Tax=Variovorax sp. E3 TaxID=1914993 RepID=UPI0018DE4EC6|nr:ABC transporter ATP-binding protein [Variovorax sp. E3]
MIATQIPLVERPLIPPSSPHALSAAAVRPHLIEAQGVFKRYGGLTVLRDVTLGIREGSIVGLIGPNGAGKSTFFNVLTGFARPDEGTVRFGDRDITSASPEQRNRMGLARTFQIVKPFQHLTVLENAMVGALGSISSTAEAKKTARGALQRTGLVARADQPAHSLTLSDLKRLEFARCLATQPKVLLLDEVMGGLNLTEMREMIELVAGLRQEGMTIVLVEHIMDAITALADELHVLASGELIASGSPQLVLRHPRVIEAYLGEDLGDVEN